MSKRVVPALADLDETKVRVCHLVPEGHDKCVICNVSKFRQSFHYMTEPELFTHLTQSSEPGDPIGLWVVSEEMISGFTLCGHQESDVPQVGHFVRGVHRVQ